MKNPFTSVLGKTKDKIIYVKTYKNALPVIFAAGMCDSYARTILDLAAEAMDRNNECTVCYADLDKVLGIKQPKTRTKAINLLRVLGLIETVNGNRKGVILFRLNSRAFGNSSEINSKTDGRFCEPLNKCALDADGMIDKKYVETYRFYEKSQAKVELYVGIDF